MAGINVWCNDRRKSGTLECGGGPALWLLDMDSGTSQWDVDVINEILVYGKLADWNTRDTVRFLKKQAVFPPGPFFSDFVRRSENSPIFHSKVWFWPKWGATTLNSVRSELHRIVNLTEYRIYSFMKNFRIPNSIRSLKFFEYRIPNIFVHEEFPNTEYRIVFIREKFPNTE